MIPFELLDLLFLVKISSRLSFRTDPPVAPFCLECLANDLDLYLTKGGSSGRVFPNGLSHADRSNNAERIVIDDAREGDTFTVHVEATDLLEAQDYSLVVTGCFSDFDVPEVTPVCRDSDGDISINSNDGARSCSWLASNLYTYGYLCKFMDIASRCQQTCGFCDKVLVPSSFNGKKCSWLNRTNVTLRPNATRVLFGVK